MRLVYAHTSTLPGPCKRGVPAGEPDDHVINRSHGGLTMKIHLTRYTCCRPLAVVLTVGQAVTRPAFSHVMAAFAFLGGQDGPAPGWTGS